MNLLKIPPHSIVFFLSPKYRSSNCCTGTPEVILFLDTGKSWRHSALSSFIGRTLPRSFIYPMNEPIGLPGSFKTFNQIKWSLYIGDMLHRTRGALRHYLHLPMNMGLNSVNWGAFHNLSSKLCNSHSALNNLFKCARPILTQYPVWCILVHRQKKKVRSVGISFFLINFCFVLFSKKVTHFYIANMFIFVIFTLTG